MRPTSAAPQKAHACTTITSRAQLRPPQAPSTGPLPRTATPQCRRPLSDGAGPIGGRAAAAGAARGAAAPAASLALPGSLDGGALLQVLRSTLHDLEDAQDSGADEEARGLLAQLEAQLAALGGGGGGGGAAERPPLHEAANGGTGGGGAGPLGALDLQNTSQIDWCAGRRATAYLPCFSAASPCIPPGAASVAARPRCLDACLPRRPLSGAHNFCPLPKPSCAHPAARPTHAAPLPRPQAHPPQGQRARAPGRPVPGAWLHATEN
jgi:hypothetical protein